MADNDFYDLVKQAARENTLKRMGLVTTTTTNTKPLTVEDLKKTYQEIRQSRWLGVDTYRLKKLTEKPTATDITIRFKVGDFVYVIQSANEKYSGWGKIHEVDPYDSDVTYAVYFSKEDDWDWVRNENIDLEKSLNSTTNTNLKSGEKPMAYNSEVALLNLSADDRLFRKEDITSSDGSLTGCGRDFVVQVWFEANKAAVAEKLRAVVAARKDIDADEDL